MCFKGCKPSAKVNIENLDSDIEIFFEFFENNLDNEIIIR